MNGAFLHLAFNHIPVLGVPFCLLLLLGGLARKSRDLVQAGFVGLILVALLTIVSFKTGGPAARVAHAIPGVARADIHAHAEAGEKGFWAVEILGIAAVIGAWLVTRVNGVPNAWAALTVVAALAISVWLGWVAHLGGLIRHPEIGSAYVIPEAK